MAMSLGHTFGRYARSHRNSGRLHVHQSLSELIYYDGYVWYHPIALNLLKIRHG